MSWQLGGVTVPCDDGSSIDVEIRVLVLEDGPSEVVILSPDNLAPEGQEEVTNMVYSGDWERY